MIFLAICIVILFTDDKHFINEAGKSDVNRVLVFAFAADLGTFGLGYWTGIGF